jgi:hypothetical protein
MNCKWSEKDIALFVERDLASAKAREIEAHLASCAACRTLAADLAESQAVFKTLKQDNLSAAALSSLRSRVLAELGTGKVRPAWGRWVYALAGVGCLALMGAGSLWYMQTPPPPVQQAVMRAPVPPAEAAPLYEGHKGADSAPDRVPAAKRTRRKPPQPPAQEPDQVEIPAEPPRQLVVKLLTDDPDIVIYWLVEQNGGGL